MSDGTARGTRMVRDVNPGPESSFPWMLTSLGDLVAFEGRDGSDGEPWLSDGTSEGTRMAALLGTTAAPRAFTRADGRIYCVSTARLWVLTGSSD